MLWNPNQRRNVCFLSTFAPRKCGIAVFTNDIVDHLDFIGDFAPVKVIAITQKDDFIQYGKRVNWLIRQEEEKDYIDAANFINGSNFDLVNIQHEFGIFGGERGRYILSFLKMLCDIKCLNSLSYYSY